MEQGGPVPPLPEGKEPGHLGRGEALEVSAQPRLKRDTDPGSEEQRKQELAGELSVADPRLTWAVGLERADVDEHRPAVDELDVVRGGVLDGQPGGEGALEQVELEDRRVLEHGEGPLVWVADEGEQRVLQGGGVPRGRVGDLDRSDESAVVDRCAKELGPGQGTPPLQSSLVEQTDGLVLVEDDT